MFAHQFGPLNKESLGIKYKAVSVKQSLYAGFYFKEMCCFNFYWTSHSQAYLGYMYQDWHSFIKSNFKDFSTTIFNISRTENY